MSRQPTVRHMPRASTLEILVADTWRTVRWAHCGGIAICDTCHDGVDLCPIKADPRNPALRRYTCRSCQRIVTDWSDTWLAPLKAPLARWAWLVLHEALKPDAGPEIVGRQINLRHHTIRGMRDKLATAMPSSNLKTGVEPTLLHRSFAARPTTLLLLPIFSDRLRRQQSEINDLARFSCDY
jgi:hypothetical protein